ncbi:MAG: epoxyqueuosine reductase [Armatimonadia bacterium]|nr:epoxyqueuosine reductase [Armatimonadia bacterium]
MIPLDELRALLTDAGASLVECADLSELPQEPRQSFPRAVAIAIALDPQIVSEILTGPTLEYAAEYDRVNALLADLGEATAEHLRGRGARASATDPTTGHVDRERLATPLPHKTVATRAGLGWIGRTALLVTKGYGSALRLTSVLTDATLPTGDPIDKSQCGVCGLCVTACPAQAATGDEWSVGLPREHMYDAWKCLDRCRYACERLGIEHTICGVCISVCPWTRRYLDEAGA